MPFLLSGAVPPCSLQLAILAIILGYALGVAGWCVHGWCVVVCARARRAGGRGKGGRRVTHERDYLKQIKL